MILLIDDVDDFEPAALSLVLQIVYPIALRGTENASI